jgi:hypothetical protein
MLDHAVEAEAAASAEPKTCEEGSAALSAAADGHMIPLLCERSVRAVCPPGDQSAARAAPAGAAASDVQTSAKRDAAVGLVVRLCLTAGVADAVSNAFIGAANVNTCEPGVESEPEPTAASRAKLRSPRRQGPALRARRPQSVAQLLIAAKPVPCCLRCCWQPWKTRPRPPRLRGATWPR